MHFHCRLIAFIADAHVEQSVLIGDLGVWPAR
jgi:hypothetical protein